jgi:hypothetical protein
MFQETHISWILKILVNYCPKFFDFHARIFSTFDVHYTYHAAIKRKLPLLWLSFSAPSLSELASVKIPTRNGFEQSEKLLVVKIKYQFYFTASCEI